MSWSNAKSFCESGLARPNISNRSGFFWIDQRLMYYPRNPLEGWHWVNGSKFTVTGKLFDKGSFPSTGYERRCGAMKNGTVVGRDCGLPSYFICKKTGQVKKIVEELRNLIKNFTPNVLLDITKTIKKAGPSLCEEKGLCENVVNNVTTSISNTFCNLSKSEDTKQEMSIEEFISAFTGFLKEVVQKPSFNASFKTKTDQLELDIITDHVEKILNSTYSTVAELLPHNTTENLCQNNSDCIVKAVVLKIMAVKLNTSLISETSQSAVADVVSLDVFADGHAVKKFHGNETIEIDFKKREQSDAKKVDKHCVFLNETNQWSDEGLKVNTVDEENVQCITSHLTSFAMVVTNAKLDKNHQLAVKYISYIGSGLSLIGLVSTILVYVTLYKDLLILTTSRHLVHFNLQLSLGLTQVIFLTGGGGTENALACRAVAILLHYFSLASFCWMLLEGAMLYLKLISVYGGEVVAMKGFYAFGWGFPFFFVAVAALLKSDGYGTSEWCWISYEKGFFWVFFAPVIIITMLNLIVLLAVIRVLVRVTKTHGDTKQNIIASLRGVIILFPVLGLSWVFSVISVNHDSLVWKYLFAIFNSLQGFLIFVIYGVCNQEIQRVLKRKLGGEVSPTTTVFHLQVMPIEHVKH